MKRLIGLVALLSCLATPWLWWQSERPVPRATALQQVNGGTRQFFTSDAQLFVCGDDEQIRVYDVRRGERLATWPRSIQAVICGPPNGSALVALSTADGVEVFDLIRGETVGAFSPGQGIPVRTHLAPNGKIAATDHNNQTLRIWAIGTGQQLAEYPFPQTGVGPVAFSPDSTRLAVAQPGGPVRIIDLSTRTVAIVSASMNRGVIHPLFTPDERLLGLAELNADEFGLWDLTDDRLVVRGRKASCGFLSGGSYWYANHYPFWNLASLAKRIGADQAARQLLELSPQRQIFDTKSGQVVARVPPAISGVFPDGQTFATYSRVQDCVQLWDVPPSTMVHSALAWGVRAGLYVHGMVVALAPRRAGA